MARRRSDKIWWNKPCVNCGYNLRGLHGDPVTCPECGFVSPRKKPRELKARVARRVATVGSPLTLAIACCLCFVWGGAVIAMGFIRIGGATCIACAGLWCACIWWFRRRCESHPAWRGIALRFHVATLAVVAVGGLICFLVWNRQGIVGRFIASSLLGQCSSLLVCTLLTIVAGFWATNSLERFVEQREYERMNAPDQPESESQER